MHLEGHEVVFCRIRDQVTSTKLQLWIKGSQTLLSTNPDQTNFWYDSKNGYVLLQRTVWKFGNVKAELGIEIDGKFKFHFLLSPELDFQNLSTLKYSALHFILPLTHCFSSRICTVVLRSEAGYELAADLWLQSLSHQPQLSTSNFMFVVEFLQYNSSPSTACTSQVAHQPPGWISKAQFELSL